MQKSLPIWQLHGPIVDTLRAGNRLVLVAPTGSGKTTQVPQMLADTDVSSWEFGVSSSGDAPTADNSKPATPNPKPFRIVILQPRRVAARTVAARVAWERGCKLGEEVGYQIRFDDRLGDATRICFVTEGVLLRWLQDDQNLSDVAAVLFDEFHERNLLSDVALALVKRLQQTTRPDLRIVVMSATLDAEPVAKYLGQAGEQVQKRECEKSGEPLGSLSHALTFSPAPILVSEGISFPVEVRYAEHLDRRPAPEQAADAVERIVNFGGPGDVLVFMPGMGEINGTINALRAARLAEDCDFIPLHGDLQPEQQDLAFSPSSRRKIVVSTNVAETSVTIDGIRHVVDSGEARVARYDAERGIQTLFIEEISRASADQRKGRAGRTAPGTCWRLWTESGHLNRPERNTPEIQRADLAEVVLLLHSLGIRSAVTFDWLDQPDPTAVERAERLLVTLGALRAEHVSRLELGVSGSEAAASEAPDSSRNSKLETRNTDLSSIGRQMLRLPMHPRYSRMLVEAGRRGCVPAAALCAALVSGRDLLQRVARGDSYAAEKRELFEASQDSDFFTLMRAQEFARQNSFNLDACRRYGINAKVAREVEQTYQQVRAIAERERLGEGRVQSSEFSHQSERAGAQLNAESVNTEHSTAKPDDDALLKCLTAGFIDQLAIRRDQGTLECELTEGRQGTLMRESVVQKATLFVAAAIRETDGALRPLTLLGLATAVKPEWLKELYPQHLNATVEHLFDRTHKRVAAVKLARFRDLVIGHEHLRDADPDAAGRCLAQAAMRGWFDLPNMSHEVKQFIARVNLVAAALPDLEYPPFDEAALTAALARAFRGLTLQRDAMAAPLKEAFAAHLAPEQVGWLDELTPTQIPWTTGKPVKLLYSEEAEGGGRTALSPEASVKLQECFKLEFHPLICEGAVPVKFWLCGPDNKRIASTCDWPHWKANEWPKQRAAIQKKFPSVTFA